MSGVIGITLGDPAGVGPEIIAAALARLDARKRSSLRVFADAPILAAACRPLGGVPPEVRIDDRGVLGGSDIVAGHPTTAGGAAQVAYLEAAIAAARRGEIAGLVTAPISKTQARAAGFAFPGHTELLAERLQAPAVAMMFAGPSLRVVLATVHVALAHVAAELCPRRLVEVIRLAATTMQRDFAVPRPRVGVVGLNPHAGEGGLFGREELDVIGPAIASARQLLGEAVSLTGPLVPDAAFRDAVGGAYDVLIAMYHDQALIPVKLVDFERAVNVTLGLPIIRTSPDHGTAYDIAGKGLARPDSFIAALELAFELVARRAMI